jgi:NAD(P)H dehydrogenase (quinone)
MTVFLVTGATGKLGGAALRSLLQRDRSGEVRVLVRTERAATAFSARGLTVRIADYDNRVSLDAAFSGVERAICISSPVLDPGVRTGQHRAVIESAVAAGVHHIVYTSGVGARKDPGHSAAEDALVDSGVSHVILRNGLYTDPFVAHAVEEGRATGVITSASGGQLLATAAIADLGDAAAAASVHWPTTSLWELRGPRWDFGHLAAVLSAALKRRITHSEVSDQTTGAFAAVYPLVRAGAFAAETRDLTELLGRAPATIADVVDGQLSGASRG